MQGNETKRVALYARSASNDELSLQAQLERGREYAETNGSTVTREYSNAQGETPGLPRKGIHTVFTRAFGGGKYPVEKVVSATFQRRRKLGKFMLSGLGGA